MAGRPHLNFQPCSPAWHDRTGFFLHLEANQLGLCGLHYLCLSGIDVAELADRNLVFARLQQDLFPALEFLQISNVLAINSNA
jgi:hypothetical protein